MKQLPVLLLSIAAVAGCAQIRDAAGREPAATTPGASAAEVPATAPETPEQVAAVVTAPPPSAAARTIDQLDTTTDAQKAAATAAPSSEGRRLGEAVASLGDPTDPGLWVRTALVSGPTAGRVEYQGRSALVELRPGSPGGAQVSLAAMRLIEAPLTDLPTVVIYAE